MAATLQSILPNEVILPPDLLGDDDTIVIYDDNGKPLYENGLDDPDPGFEELEDDRRNYSRLADLALAYYNAKHDSDYKVVPFRKTGGVYMEHEISGYTFWSHCGFMAAPSSTPFKSAAQYFCAKLYQAERDSEEVVTFCNIVDGIEPSGCECCDTSIRKYGIKWVEDVVPRKSCEMEDEVSPLSQCSRHLADGVILSDKAKLRIRYALLALAYYNKKQHTDYKLVDILPYCTSFYACIVVHCNFIARQNAPGAPNKLFFAELMIRKGDWFVTTCRGLRGNTIAGCDHCTSHAGKRVIHPTRGFRFGDPTDFYPKRRLRSHRAKRGGCYVGL